MVFNYLDRQMIAVLKPTLQHEYRWREAAYAGVVIWFQAAYAVSYLVSGRIIDRVGARAGYAGAFLVWSVGHMLHGVVSGLGGFIAARVVLGAGESASFPAGLKAVAEWFPRQERALATGLFNAGANVGAVLTPLIVPPLALAFGWRWAFIVTGVASLAWLAAWLLFYRRPEADPKVSPAELAWIRSDGPEPAGRMGWLQVLRQRETWAYALARFLIDPVWWVFLFWLPDFLGRRFGLDLKTFGPPLVAIYLMSDVGSVAGGWMSSALIARGVSVNLSRKATLLACALAVTPVVFAAHASSLWLAVALLGLATAGHQAFSANLYALPADVFPRSAVGSVVGVGGMAGALGGMLMSTYTGWVLDRVGGYGPVFAVAAGAYLAALAVIQLLAPRYAAVRSGDTLAPAV
ncbi:MAG: MFS transporter [Caulobacteraceae bacterium]|nr:MFS transporter [Caulobacter sp.]